MYAKIWPHPVALPRLHGVAARLNTASQKRKKTR
jgi:hypothetical protein